MKYEVIRTRMADYQIRNLTMYISLSFGSDVALEKLSELEDAIMTLGDNPNIGDIPRDIEIRRLGFRVLVLKKDIIFYKINEEKKIITIYAIVDQRQDYLKIRLGL